MTGLDYSNEAHRRMGAFNQYFKLETFPNGDILLGHFEYNCWGEKKGGMKKVRMDAKSAQIHIKGSNVVSLELQKRGCCPPQLSAKMMEPEGETAKRDDAIEEAYKLHKRGYLGGGG